MRLTGMRSSAAERLTLGLLVICVSGCTSGGMRVPTETVPLAPLPEMTGPTAGFTAVPWTLRELDATATTAIVPLVADGLIADRSVPSAVLVALVDEESRPASVEVAWMRDCRISRL
jgi:hypothetical protein